MDLLPFALVISLAMLSVCVVLWKRREPSPDSLTASSPLAESSPTKALSIPTPASLVPPQFDPPSTFLMGLEDGGDNAGEYSVELIDAPSDTPRSSLSGKDRRNTTSDLGLPPIAERLVSVFPNASQALRQGKIVEIVGPPELVRGLKDGTVTLLRDGQGRYLGSAVKEGTPGISYQARLKELKPIVAPAIAFQVLAIATQQYYLVSINEKLDEILIGVKHLLEQMRSEAWGKVVGAEHTIREVSHQLAAGSIETAEFWPRLANAEQNLNAVMNQSKRNLAAFSARVETATSRDPSPGDCRKLLVDTEAEFLPDLMLYQAATRSRVSWFRVALARDAAVNPTSVDVRQAQVKKLADDHAQMEQEVRVTAERLREAAIHAALPDGPWGAA